MRDDHGVHRAWRCLDPGEVVLASVVGIEADGRRRRIVLLTDRRIVAVWRRGGPPVVLGYSGATCGYDRSGGLLTFASGDDEVVLRDVEAHVARTAVSLVTTRREVAARAPRTEPPPSVRIVAG
jgi:hypothetical protein